MNLSKLWHTLNLLARREGYARANYLRRKKVLGFMGEKCYFHPFWMPSDPKLIFIHNNVAIAAGVTFINHDIAGAVLNEKNNTSKFEYWRDTIEIYDNVMIGAGTVILPGVKIGPDVIIGAGSVVSKNIPPGAVAAGNPVRVIGTVKEFEEKRLAAQGKRKELERKK